MTTATPRVLLAYGQRYVRADYSSQFKWGDYELLRGPQTLTGWDGHQYLPGISVPAGKFAVVRYSGAKPIVWRQRRDLHGHGGGWAIFDTERAARDFIYSERDDDDDED